MLIQSILFFILGIAATALILILLAPAIWRRALYLARKAIAAELPLTLTEIEADRDFLRARHAVEIVKRDEKYNALFEKFGKEKCECDTLKEQLCHLSTVEQRARLAEEELADTKDELENEKHVAATLHRFKGKTLNQIRDIVKEERHAQMADMKREEELQKLQQEVGELQQELAASARRSEINRKTKGEIGKLREEILDIAARFTAKTAEQEGASSPIIDLVKKARGKKSLAARIKNDLTENPVKTTTRLAKSPRAKSRLRTKTKPST